MGRAHRPALGGSVYHVLNRATARLPIFASPADFDAFVRVLEEAVERYRTRLLAYAVISNHRYLVVWPREDGELSQFVGWLTLTHTQRWHAQRRSVGSGHLYQGRFSQPSCRTGLPQPPFVSVNQRSFAVPRLPQHFPEQARGGNR